MVRPLVHLVWPKLSNKDLFYIFNLSKSVFLGELLILHMEFRDLKTDVFATITVIFARKV